MKKQPILFGWISAVLCVSICITPCLAAEQEIKSTPKTFDEIVARYDSLLSNNQLEGALLLLNKNSEKIIGSEKHTELKQIVQMRRIESNYNQGNFIECIASARDFISQSNLEDSLLANAYTYLGNSYFKFGEYGIALDSYLKSLKIGENLQLYSAVSLAVSNVGLLYSKLNELEEALRYYRKSNKLHKLHFGRPSSLNYNQLAYIYIRLEKFDIAENYIDSAMNIAQKHDEQIQLAYAIKMRGLYYKRINNAAKSITYYEQARQKYKQIGRLDQVFNCVRNISKLHMRAGNYNDVIQLCESNISLAYQMNDLENVVALSDLLYESYIAKGKYKEAIFIKQNFQQAQDSIESSRENNKLFKIQMRLEAEKKITENLLLKQQKLADQETIKVQNTLLYSVIIGLILTVIITVIIYKSYIIKKQLNSKIQKQSDKLTELDQAKSRFFANISHDLRTPLTLIKGGIEQVLNSKDLLLTSDAERKLKTGLLNCERIVHLTNEINELIKLEEGKLVIHKKFIDIDQMLKLFVQIFSSMADLKQINLSYSKSIFDEAPVAQIDPVQFEKVLFNLITNSFNHTQKGDSITIGLSKNQDALSISVIDSGEGIPEKNTPYIFNRYYQAPDATFKSHEGFGIGLALVKEVIGKHGAKIEVKSKLGEGTEFSIDLPIEYVDNDNISKLSELTYSDETRNLFKEIDEAASIDAPIINLSSNPEKTTILVVEDHHEVRGFITDIISDNYNVLTAVNGKKALKVLEKEHVDLIITDLMMPWFDGFELLEQLRKDEKLRKIPALVLSARTSEEDKEKVLYKGVNDFLCKPFNPKELLLRVENLLQQKNNWNNSKGDALFINNQQTLDDIEKSLLKKIEHLILEKIDDSGLSISYLANEVAMSERKFYRMINKLTQGTPLEYIKEVRMQFVNQLLKEKTFRSASELSRMIGMNNVSHFNTQFKKRFGKFPTEMMQ